MSNRLNIAALIAFSIGAFCLHPAQAQTSDVLRYSATTTNMEPDGISLRFDVIKWSDTDATASVIDSLRSDAAQEAIDSLPTLGYVWPENSPVGYSIKYAKREETESGERLTFVTNRMLGSYDFGGWTVQGSQPENLLEYSVIELDLSGNGNGTGFASLATPVELDAATASISLSRETDPLELFVGVRRIENGY